MEKILMIGALDEPFHEMQDELKNRFQVTICVPVLKNIEGMIKVSNPDLILYIQQRNNATPTDIFKGFATTWKNIPVLIICEADEADFIRGYAQGPQFSFMYRPIKGKLLIMKCETILGNELTPDEPVVKAPVRIPSGKRQILVIDDSPIVLRNIKMILEEQYEVTITTSGQKALEIIEQKIPDLILLDYDMPEVDGVQVFKNIKKMPCAKNIPVLFLTGVTDRERIMKALTQHPAGYILKPLDRELIIQKIQGVLEF